MLGRLDETLHLGRRSGCGFARAAAGHTTACPRRGSESALVRRILTVKSSVRSVEGLHSCLLSIAERSPMSLERKRALTDKPRAAPCAGVRHAGKRRCWWARSVDADYVRYHDEEWGHSRRQIGRAHV